MFLKDCREVSCPLCLMHSVEKGTDEHQPLKHVRSPCCRGGHSRESSFGPWCLYPWGGRKEDAKRVGGRNILCVQQTPPFKGTFFLSLKL